MCITAPGSVEVADALACRSRVATADAGPSAPPLAAPGGASPPHSISRTGQAGGLETVHVTWVPAIGATHPEPRFHQTISVSADNAQALQAGLAKAFADQSRGRSTRVILAPGLYRGSFKVGRGAAPDAWVRIEAQVPGTAILSGADPLGGFVECGGMWRARWPYKWGLGPVPPNHGNPYLVVGDLMRRREMVIVDGVRLRQVLSAVEIEPGCFLVDEAGDTIYITLSDGGAPGRASVETAVRSTLLHLVGRENVVVCGLVFRHDNSVYYQPQRAALQLTSCRNVLVEDCDFVENNNKGLQIDGPGSEDVSLRRLRFFRNGCLGFLVTRCRNLLIEHCETSFNNWRGGLAGWRRGSPCGFKVMQSERVTLRGHRAIRNDATGGWFDEDNREVLIEDCVFYGNRRGLHLEATTGPVLVRRCEIVSNRQEPSVNESRWAFGSGLVLTHAANVTVEDCVVADNDVAQFGIRDDRATRTLADPATGARSLRRTEAVAFRGNTIVSTGPHRAFLHVPHETFDGGIFWQGFHADSNYYIGPPGLDGFLVGETRPGGGTAGVGRAVRLSFSAWRARTGLDAGAFYDEH